jgi:hypothetical protein
MIDTVSGKSKWTYDPIIIVIDDNHFVAFFTIERKRYMTIFGN